MTLLAQDLDLARVAKVVGLTLDEASLQIGSDCPPA